jgi:hypothetical protein
MPWQNFVVEMLKTVIWPAAIVFVAIYFKGPLSRLIDRIIKLGIGPAGMECETLPEDKLPKPAPSSETLQARGKPSEPPPFNHLSPEARKVLKTLWKFQLEIFPDYTNRFGFRADPMGGVSGEIFQSFNKGRNELMAYGLVTTDYRLFCFLTDSGVKYCTINAAQIDKETNFYDNFKPG